MRQRLQIVNSEGYNAAAQAQAETSSNNAAAPEGSSAPKAEKKDEQTPKKVTVPGRQFDPGIGRRFSNQTQGNYRDRLEAAGVVGKSEAPVGMIEFNPANGNATSLSNSLAMMIEKRVERTLDNPDSTIQDLHDAIVFTLADGNGRVSASASVLTDVYKAFNAMKEGKLSKADVLDYVKELMYTKDKLASVASETAENPNAPKIPSEKISNEHNEYGKPFIKSEDGTTTFGEITEADGLPAAPIKLSVGENTTDSQGKHHGYGLLHIEAGHGEQIRKAGFPSVEAFVETVARNFDTIKEGNRVGENQTYLLEVSDEHNNTLFVELSKDGTYWNVNSAGIFRTRYSKNKKKVEPLPTIGSNSNAEVAGVNHGTTEGETVTSENSPMTSSAAKVQQNPETPVNNSENLKFSDGTPVPMTVDSKGRPTPDYANMTPNQAVEILKKELGEDAQTYVSAQIKKAQKALNDADAMEIDMSGDVNDIKEAKANKQAMIDAAQKQLAHTQAIDRALKASEGDNIIGGGGTDANRYEQERKQGYKIGAGNVRYDRQSENQPGLYGNEVEVAFTPERKVKGKVKVVEADTVQGSHKNGQTNPLHFGADWQPKDRTGEASKLGAERIASAPNPELITGSGNAFIGSAPSVNTRHETIQGNNRIEALQMMYRNFPEQAKKYKQWLIDNAERFGLDSAEIAKMDKPIVVNELPVDDATAKELGQYKASDFETGGREIPTESSVINLMGDKLQNFANVLLTSTKLDAKDGAILADYIAENSNKALMWLRENGYITNTQYETLSRDISERNRWFERVLKTSLFDGDKELETAFNTLPANAQKAVLATFMRDLKSVEPSRIKENLKNSFNSFNDLMQNAEFAKATNLAQARAAVKAEVEHSQKNMYGEAPISEKYTNFELELAALYKGLKDQKTLKGLFDKYFDKVQGMKGKELGVFDTEGTEPTSKDEALKEVFNTNNLKPKENDRRRETEHPSGSGEGNGNRPRGREPERGVEQNRKVTVSGVNGDYDVTVEDKQVPFTELKEGDKFVGKDNSVYTLTSKTDDGNYVVNDSNDSFVVGTKDGENWSEWLQSKPSVDRLAKEQSGTSDPLEALERNAGQHKQEQMRRNGQEPSTPETKSWGEMNATERLAEASKKPLAEQEIREKTSEDNQDLIEDAIDYINGNHGFTQQIAYLKIYDDVRNRHEDASNNSGAEDQAQLAETNNGGSGELGLGTGRGSGRPAESVDRGGNNETPSRESEREPNSKDGTDTVLGEGSNRQGEGNSPTVDTVPTGSSNGTRSGSTGSNGRNERPIGRRGGSRPVGKDGQGSTTTKPGITVGGRTKAEIDQEANDAKSSLLDALKNLRKKGRGGAPVISIVPLNNEQIEYLPEVMKAVKRYGTAIINQGVYKAKEWFSNIREVIADEMKSMGFVDDEIDDFIREMWKSKMTLDGETHTIEEWAGIYGHEELKKKLAQPLEEKRKLQQQAENVSVKVGDKDNIAETLPFLLPEQQNDVLKAETQFFDKSHADDAHGNGRGMLFTNGTGTGKTYTGLGIIKRFVKQDKGRVLIITPSQTKVSDWIGDGKNLGLNIKRLSDTKDKGDGVVTFTD